MPSRGSFKHEDAQQGGGFQEGYLHIIKSVVAVHQFPPNSKTGDQSDPFTCMRWTAKKLDSEWNELTGEETDTTVVIPIRLGAVDDVRPGKLSPKDFDNLEALPEDLGGEVDTEGNAFILEDDKKAGRGWAIMEESLRKQGFKPEISGRGVASDFEGMVAHFKTVEGAKYIAKQGAKKGQEVTPTNLVCDRIHTYPYEAKKKGSAATKVKESAAATAAATAAQTKANGAAGDGDVLDVTKGILGNLSPEFKKDVPKGKEVGRADFQKAMTKELMRQKINPKIQKAVMDFIKSDDGIAELAMAMVDNTGEFATDGSTVTFA